MISGQQKTHPDRPWLDPNAVPQISIEGVTKTYGGVTAVDNVSLRIFKGEMFALVGRIGLQQDDAAAMLAGFAHLSERPPADRGVDMTGVPPHERPVNMMFQSYALFPHMTVEDNVGYGLRQLPLEKAVKAKRVEEALEELRRWAKLRTAQAASALGRPEAARGARPCPDPKAEGAATR